MSVFSNLIEVIIGTALIPVFILLYRIIFRSKSLFPTITIDQKIIERKNGIAVFRLTFHPGPKTVDIIKINAPDRKIQIAQIDKKLWDPPEISNIVIIVFLDVYNSEKSGPFTDAITERIRLLPQDVEKKVKQLNIAIPDDGKDEVLLKIKTDQSWFAQKFIAMLKTDDD